MRNRLISADNYILIKEYKDDPKFRVSEQCASVDINEDVYTSGYDNLEDATRYASSVEEFAQCEGFPVEYGIKIDLINND